MLFRKIGPGEAGGGAVCTDGSVAAEEMFAAFAVGGLFSSDMTELI